MALLVYLAAKRPWGSTLREGLRGVFWPDYPEPRARRALNQALYGLRSALGPGVIESRGEQELLVNYRALCCDAMAFDRAVERRSPTEALALYRGDFLPGFSLSRAPEFEQWVESSRSRLRFCATDAAASLFVSARAHGRLREAIHWGRRRLELAPTDELALRDLLVVLADAGDRPGAAEAYRSFARDLARRLEMTPSLETEALLRSIRQDDPVPGGRSVAAPAHPASARRASGAEHPTTTPEPIVPIKRIRRRWAVPLGVAAALGIAHLAERHSGTARVAPHPVPEASEESLTRAGRFFWSRRNDESLQIAARFFARAVSVDERYAPAYSGLADAYALQAWYGDSASAATVEKARAAAVAAVRLQDDLAAAHTSLGGVKDWFNHDWRGAEAEYRRAIALDSSYSTAHQWYALGLAARGRIDEAVREMRTAQRHDPVSPAIATDLAMVLFWSGQEREAISQIRYALALDPASSRARSQLWRLYTAAGHRDEAIGAIERVIAARGGGGPDIVRLRRAYALEGLRGALAWWAELLAHSGRAPDRAIRIAVLYGLLNRHDAALRWLREARDERSPFLQFATVDPAFRSLHGDPQFVNIVSSR
jgi:DNA-binding SARP family transcriptional activator